MYLMLLAGAWVLMLDLEDELRHDVDGVSCNIKGWGGLQVSHCSISGVKCGAAFTEPGSTYLGQRWTLA
jgi:hypothetical protein